MQDLQTSFGYATIIIGIISYSFYLTDVVRGKTKPDGFSWLIWGVLASITYFAQREKGAGPGAWATALTAMVCIIIAILAFARGANKSKLLDWISLFLALSGVVAWRYTHNPLWAVIIVILVGALGFVPTFYKAFNKPLEETAITYALNAMKFAISLFALNTVNLVTVLYPVAMVFMNTSLPLMIYFRRKRIA